jgi:hypothetical protein
VPVRVWAWEFLRRSTAYRKFWQEKIQPLIDKGAWPRQLLIAQFGVSLPSPPWIRTPPAFVAEGTYLLSNDETGLLQRIPLEDNHIAIVIDLTRPLEGQFQRAFEVAKGDQQIAQRKGDQQIAQRKVRIRADNYVRYLRVLDADEARARPGTIAGLLYPDLDGPPQNNRLQALYEDRKVARRMRDGGYRLLLEAR